MPSFDTVLDPDLVEVKNAVDQAGKEIGTRFDFKGSSSKAELKDKEITLYADNEFQLGQVLDILLAKLTKRNVDARFLDRDAKIEKIGGDKVKQLLVVRSGIDAETAKKLQTTVKQSKIKVQASIQGDTVRVVGAKRDDLQAAMALIRKEIADQPLSFNNFAIEPMKRLAAAAVVVFCAFPATGQTVSMAGSLGSNALLVVDGKPRTVAVGATVDGIRLVSVTGTEAVVEVKGKRLLLRFGDAQVNLGGKASEGGGKQIVLTAQSGGHFQANGAINGQSVRFMVDTGATMVSMDKYEAERLGIDYKNGKRGMTRTANGDVPFYTAKLATVRIGDVLVYNVDAVVLPAPMPYILLGNSFLTRFQMKRENDVMTLDLRY